MSVQQATLAPSVRNDEEMHQNIQSSPGDKLDDNTGTGTIQPGVD